MAKQKLKANVHIQLLSISILLLFFGFSASQQYVTTFFTSLGMPSTGFISLLIAYSFFMIFCLVGSLIVSKYGAKRSIIVGVFFYITYILSLVTASVPIVYAASVLLGIGSGLVWVGQNSYAIRASSKRKYGTNTGFLNSLQFIGQLVGIAFAGVLVVIFLYKMTFLFLSIFPIIGFILLFKMKDIRARPQKDKFKTLTKVASNPLALRVAALGFSTFFLTGLNATVIPLEIKDVLGVPYIGALSAIFFIMPAILAYTFGKRSDIVGRMKMIPYSYAVTILGLILLYFANSIIVLAAGIFLLALNAAVVRPIGMALVGDVSSEKTVEPMSGLYWVITVFGFVVALLISLIFPARVVYIAAIVLMVISFLVVMPLFRYDLGSIKAKLAKHVG